MDPRLIILCFLMTAGAAWSVRKGNNFVVSSSMDQLPQRIKRATNSASNLKIYEMNITSTVYTRFARTVVTSVVRNEGNTAKEAIFTVVLPQQAFISEFVMEVGGKRYTAYVEKREEAQNIYQTAVAKGQTAAQLSANIRDSNKFSVFLNVEPKVEAIFLLTYEELLQRKMDRYEIILNIYPGQVIDRLHAEVKINESRPLSFVKVLPLRSGNEIKKNENGLRPVAEIRRVSLTKAHVRFYPSPKQQKQFAQNLGTNPSNGLAAQFVVEYDVERDSYGGEMLLQDGYFVHFFAVKDFEPLPSHIVFVLDKSGSMANKKISQLKDAMNSIVKDIRFGDKVSIIDFTGEVNVWNINSARGVAVKKITNYEAPFAALSKQNLPSPVQFSQANLVKIKNIIKLIKARGTTNLIDPLEVALYIVKADQERTANQNGKKYHPIIVFLTDGQPVIGIRSTDKIIDVVTKLNSNNNNVPIYSLSFGNSAAKSFLKKLSLRNHGVYKHIYEASDASLQLQDFYKQISTPLLSHIRFIYDSDDVTDLTNTDLQIYMGGSEYIVVGKYTNPFFSSYINCTTAKGSEILQPSIEMPVIPLERIWAYLTLRQILDKRSTTQDKSELTKKATDLALKYSFVTEVTSLVVVKPNDTTVIHGEDDTDSDLLIIPRFKQRLGFSSGKDEDQPRINSPLIKTLPWLEAYLNINGTFIIYESAFELGDSSFPLISTEAEDCEGTPLNTTATGRCSILVHCPRVHSYLTDFSVYEKYFCAFEIADKIYAGVCCPKR